MTISLRMSQYRKSAIYAGIADQTGAIIDCGAAIGHETAEIRNAGSSGPFVMVEPFPGNIELIAKKNYPFDFVLHEKALNNDGRNVSFFIPQIVDATAGGRWKGLAGYSSTGHIPLTFMHKAKALYRKLFSGGHTIRVGGTTLDQVCAPYEKIRLIKTDLQGAEYEALEGAKETLVREAADIFILEFVGDVRIFDFFDQDHYDVYPIEMLRMGKTSIEKLPGFHRFETDLSSTNKSIEYFRAEDPERCLTQAEFMQAFQKNFSQCDLLVVHKRASSAFVSAVQNA